MRKGLILAILSTVFFARGSPALPIKSPRPSAAGAEIVREMNFARQHPQIYARQLEELRDHFRGDVLVLPGRTVLRTREGAGALDDAIRFLRCARPIAPLIFSPGISLAAADHVADQAAGAFGHNGSDHSDPGERMNRHGTWSMFWGENIFYGKSPARDVVMALIIDDGLSGRKHRTNIFNPAFNYAGAALGSNARYGTACSIDFAGGYVESGPRSRSPFARN
jgi:uncharacterized protein YkwD